jgi:hypothetical protein
MLRPISPVCVLRKSREDIGSKLESKSSTDERSSKSNPYSKLRTPISYDSITSILFCLFESLGFNDNISLAVLNIALYNIPREKSAVTISKLRFSCDVLYPFFVICLVM